MTSGAIKDLSLHDSVWILRIVILLVFTPPPFFPPRHQGKAFSPLHLLVDLLIATNIFLLYRVGVGVNVCECTTSLIECILIRLILFMFGVLHSEVLAIQHNICGHSVLCSDVTASLTNSP